MDRHELHGTTERAELRNRWKWFVGFGVVLVILGAIALWNVVDATLVTTIFIGWLLVLGGIVQIIGAFAASGSMGARVLMGLVGILYAIVGFNIVADPLQGAVALTIVIAIVLIVEGIIRLFAAFNEATPQRGLVAVLAVINILLGLWLWAGSDDWRGDRLLRRPPAVVCRHPLDRRRLRGPLGDPIRHPATRRLTERTAEGRTHRRTRPHLLARGVLRASAASPRAISRR